MQELGPGVGKEVNVVFVGGTREEPLGSSGSVSEGEPCADPATTAANMLEKPEDVLQKRIKELENVENYLRQQVTTTWQCMLLIGARMHAHSLHTHTHAHPCMHTHMHAHTHPLSLTLTHTHTQNIHAHTHACCIQSTVIGSEV